MGARQAAISAGETHYSTGKPCIRGHMALRRVLNGTCVTCANERTTKWQRANPDVGRASARRYRGLPDAAYPAPGYCEVCLTTDPGRKHWNLDHNHTTGVFRGWVCGRCNRGMGCFKDDAATVEQAFAYLRIRNNPGFKHDV